jgi:hypothetical protein
MRPAKFPYDYHKTRPRGHSRYGSWRKTNRRNLVLFLTGGTIVAALLYFCLTK